MDLNELFESKTIPIGVLIIVIAYLIGYQLFKHQPLSDFLHLQLDYYSFLQEY